jgi:hypothetical protein
MGWEDIIWTAVAGAVGLLSLTASAIAHHSQLVRAPSGERPAESTTEALAQEPRQGDAVEDRTIPDQRHLLIEAKNAAEKAYAQRVTLAEREFTARKDRADVHLRAAEMFFEHARKPCQTSGAEKRRSQRILDAREQLADALLEHRLVVAAAEKRLAEARAQVGDVLSAAAALEALAAPGVDKTR